MRTTLQERLKQLRVERHYTQAEISELLGISASTYGEYERGNIAPPVSKVRKLTEIYGITLDYLLGNTDFRRHNEARQLDIEQQLAMMLAYLDNQNSKLFYAGEELTQTERVVLQLGLSGLKETVEAYRNNNKQ